MKLYYKFVGIAIAVNIFRHCAGGTDAEKSKRFPLSPVISKSHRLGGSVFDHINDHRQRRNTRKTQVRILSLGQKTSEIS